MKNHILKVALGAAIIFTAAQYDAAAQSYSMTLDDCLSYAMQNNYNRQSTALTEESRQISYEQAKDNRLPNLSASVSETLSHTKGGSASIGGNYGVSSNVTIYEGGSATNTIEQNRLQSEQAKYQTAQFDDQLAIQIVETFLTALGNEDLLSYQRAVLQASEEQVKQGRTQLEWDQILESDYLMFEAQYASDLNSIHNTEISRNNSLLALKSLMSMDPSVELTIIAPDTAAIAGMGVIPSQDYFVGTAMEAMPDLDISRYNVEIAETGVKLSKSGFYPTVSLGGSVGTGHSKDFSNYGNQLSNRLNEQVGLSISIPIYSKGRNKSQVAQSKISLQQAQLSDMQSRISTEQSLIQEYQNLLAAQSKYEASRIKENAYRRSFDVSRLKFEAGTMTPVELLQQQNNYISTMNDFIQSKYSFFLRRQILDIYMGLK